ncbi:ABC transporter permease [Alkalihalobacillus alcalophilus ATCC 27647 = CGMCC 1.3604]|uniref:ABC transporter permease n=2 Tax=Alkalihalobacillus alcalophilus ATCC 27647 = CGMCC 1.3604 TaxID=1218173 RepID=A0A094XFG2_ALKAL|nr:sugar ABC transporter permease [Alkalihalobacillus alcalophilus]KGA97525.1 ABC transporter permease [Alkalihalobacillus alcalophilus ATCC 27647 = CGMCC 1.3604]MED1560778.1 sugar ABC transporter permease [Alkalihalobacillus alcalophilus]THG92434.1 ABC transporter permease [Alkalihalobacillus alcalophilus ATCC 27647 = CGMCC 1.3604]
MNKVMSNKWFITLYLLPALLLVGILIFIPLVLTGYYGLMRWDGIGAMQFIGLDNYINVVQDSKFWQSAGHSFMLALFSTLSLVIYLLVSMILASKIKGANLLRKLYLIPMLLSSVAIAQLWIKVYNPSNGMLNTILSWFGVQNPPLWLADPNIVLYSIFIPILWQYAGFYILIYYAALKGIPESIIEAAKIDGANPIQIAYRIKLPLIMGVVKVTIVLAVVGSLKYFDLIYVMTGGGPNGASEVMASYMYKLAFGNYNFGYGSAVGFMLLVITLVVTYIVRKVTADKEEIQY